MLSNKFFLISFILFPFLSYSQTHEIYKYLGIIDVEDVGQFNYQLSYKIDGNKISGSTITNAGNSNETKTYISGTISADGSVEFVETDIVRTSVKKKNVTFCMVSAQLKKRTKLGVELLEGKFHGKDKSGKSCGSGSIQLIRKVTVIPDSVRLFIKNALKDTSTLKNKEKIKILNTVSLNKVYCKTDAIKIKIYDSGYIDKDEITVYYNEQLMILRSTLSKEGNKLLLNISKTKDNILLIKTLNEGEYPPNTATIDITTAEGVVETYQLNAPANETIAIKLIYLK